MFDDSVMLAVHVLGCLFLIRVVLCRGSQCGLLLCVVVAFCVCLEVCLWLCVCVWVRVCVCVGVCVCV